jgi:hypothetical protein
MVSWACLATETLQVRGAPGRPLHSIARGASRAIGDAGDEWVAMSDDDGAAAQLRAELKQLRDLRQADHAENARLRAELDATRSQQAAATQALASRDAQLADAIEQ